MKIKVCGLREPENIRAISELGVDFIGFIFYPRSSRFVSSVSVGTGLMPDESTIREDSMGRETLIHQQHTPARVGVFVDASAQDIIARAVTFQLDYIQLHGNETPTFIANLKRTLKPETRQRSSSVLYKNVKIIKTVSIENVSDLDACRQYDHVADLLLFDTKCDTKGGSGRQFDWNLLSQYQGVTPFLLSGGIGPEDVEAVRNFHHPRCLGVDVNSKFEISPALKDVEKVKAFVNAIRRESAGYRQ